MTIATSFPPHGRLMSKLTAIGPYLREKITATTVLF